MFSTIQNVFFSDQCIDCKDMRKNVNLEKYMMMVKKNKNLKKNE